MKRQHTMFWATVTVLVMLAAPIWADQILIDENFDDISDWKDLSQAVTWANYTEPVSAFTVAGGYATLTTEAKSYAGYTTANQLKTFTAIDYAFPYTVDHSTSTLQIDYRLRWGSGSNSSEGSRFMIVVNHDYPAGGLDLDLNDKYDDFDAHWWARPAYQVRMRGTGGTTIMQYGGGLDPLGEYEVYKVSGVPQWWLAGFISSPGGLSPNPGVPGCVVTGSSLYTASWKNFRYVITPTQQEIWADDNGNGVFESNERKAVQDLTADPANPNYFYYFNNLNGVRLYWRGASASQVELDWLTVTHIGGSAPQPPAAPSNLTATAVSTDQINLSWTDNAANESGFKIERKEGAGAFAEITTVGANVVSFGDAGLNASTTYTYRVYAYNADGNSGYSNEASATTQTPPNPPAAPSNLTASAVSSSQINLVWTDNAGNESGFKIERKTGGGSFDLIAALGANVTSYGDAGLSASTAYTYRVYAYNADGNSDYSNEANATTAAPGIGIFAVSQDIGSTSPAGSATESNGVYTVKGAGADIWGKADAFHFLYRDHSGDGEIIARVTSVQNTNSWAKAGVMFREGTAANAKYAFVLQRPDKSVAFQYRTSTGGSAAGTSTTGGTTAVKWVRLVRSGNSFSAYYSTSSASGPWTKIGSTITIAMSGVKVGLAVTSHKNGTLCTATFDQVSVTGGLSKFEYDSIAEILEPQLPETFELKQNYPNPFNPSTTIEFNLPAEEHVVLEVYDIRGRLLQRLVDKVTPAGSYAVIWNGQDQNGLPVSSGTYLYRIAAGKFVETRKMTFVK